MNKTVLLLSLSNATLPFVSIAPSLHAMHLSFREASVKYSLSPFILQHNAYASQTQGTITKSAFSNFLSKVLVLSQGHFPIFESRQVVEGSEWNISYSIFMNSHSNELGGIIYAVYNGSFTILDCQLINNSAKEYGGSIYANVTQASLRCLRFDLCHTLREENTIGGNSFYIGQSQTNLEDTTFYRSWINQQTGDGVFFFRNGYSKATRINSSSSCSNNQGEIAGTHYDCLSETTYSFINAINGTGDNFIYLRNYINTSVPFFVTDFNILNCHFNDKIFLSIRSRLTFSNGFIFGNDNKGIEGPITIINCVGDFEYDGMTYQKTTKTLNIELSKCNIPFITKIFTHGKVFLDNYITLVLIFAW